jgi:hypothetical protein
MYILWALIKWAVILFVIAWVCVRVWIGCVYVFAGAAWLVASVYRLITGRSPEGWERKAFIASPACGHSTDTELP